MSMLRTLALLCDLARGTWRTSSAGDAHRARGGDRAMATIVWWVWAAGLWLVGLAFTLALLTVAKRADQHLQGTARPLPGAHVGKPELAAVGDCLGQPKSAVVIATREPRITGQVIAVAADGDATALIGQPLPPDD